MVAMWTSQVEYFAGSSREAVVSVLFAATGVEMRGALFFVAQIAYS